MKPAPYLVSLAGLLVAALVAVAACARKEDAAALLGETGTTNALLAPQASCTMVDQIGTCNEYRRGSSFALEKSLCEGLRGTFRTSGCERKGVIASCETSDGEIKRYYGGEVAGPHALTLDEASSDCRGEQMKGTFTPESVAK
ncbi:MAG: hypothetical protein JWP97_760 [Labilithrix sp.]|nr:hypothetical protein [Labilithrix sp.]